MKDNKRRTAYKILVRDILTGTYIKRPGLAPSGILTKFGEISRVNLVGIVVSVKGGKDASLMLDDGSGTLLIRFFEEKEFSELNMGDMVRVVGRPREWEATKYVVPEIVKKLSDRKWYDVHMLNVRLLKNTTKFKLPVDMKESEGEEKVDMGPYQKIINVIAILDKGDGADISEIIQNIKIPNCESIINDLIEEGEIFEVAPGKLKVLE